MTKDSGGPKAIVVEVVRSGLKKLEEANKKLPDRLHVGCGRKGMKEPLEQVTGWVAIHWMEKAARGVMCLGRKNKRVCCDGSHLPCLLSI